MARRGAGKGKGGSYWALHPWLASAAAKKAHHKPRKPKKPKKGRARHPRIRAHHARAHRARASKPARARAAPRRAARTRAGAGRVRASHPKQARVTHPRGPSGARKPRGTTLRHVAARPVSVHHPAARKARAVHSRRRGVNLSLPDEL